MQEVGGSIPPGSTNTFNDLHDGRGASTMVENHAG
jgi:hypothetical protein